MFEQYRSVPEQIANKTKAVIHGVADFISACEEEIKRGKKLRDESLLNPPKMPDYRNVDPNTLPLVSTKRLEEIINLDK